MKIVIIGAGFLGGDYLIPGYQLLTSDLSKEVRAVKGSFENLEEREKELPFPLSAGNGREILKQFQPQMIVFSPPPDQAKEIAENTIFPYCKERSEQNLSLPEIVSAIPGLSADWFSEKLKFPISAAKIMPSMAEPIAGVEAGALGASFVSLSQNAGEDFRQRVQTLLSKTGEVFFLSDHDVISLLAVKISSHLWSNAAMDICDAAQAYGQQISTQEIGSAVRFYHRKREADAQKSVYPCGEDGLPNWARHFLDSMENAWFSGLRQYTAKQELSISLEEAERINHLSYEMNLLNVQLESREKLLLNIKHHATSGGLLERGCMLYEETLSGPLRRAVEQAIRSSSPNEAFLFLQDEIDGITKAVRRHGINLK